MKELFPFEEVKIKSEFMLYTAANSFGMSKLESQKMPNVPQANPRIITDACKRPDAEKWIEAADTEWENR